MVCSAFNERKPDQIVTLCGDPDWTIIFWDIEKQRINKTMPLGLSIPATIKQPRVFQLSYNPFDVEGAAVLLTGPNNTFKYLRKNIDHEVTIEHTQINNMDQGKKISDNFTCHAWSKSTGHVLICTDAGEMIVCENSGQFKALINDAPITSGSGPIEAVISLDNGFLLATGFKFIVYRTAYVDERLPIIRVND
jgi:cilia- and flagella-associated protein 57